jgi:hypothetical protein
MTRQGKIDLCHEMPNGATVKDWLGTTLVAARIAQTCIGLGRKGIAKDSSWLVEAEDRLTQALEEVRAVRAEVDV